MTSAKKQKKKIKWSLSREALSTEVEQTSALLQLCCNWAFSLSEGVAEFQDSISDVITSLDKLTIRSRTRDLDPTQQRKIRAALWRLRQYSRNMADDSEPLSVIGICEDLGEMDELSQRLKRVLASTREK